MGYKMEVVKIIYSKEPSDWREFQDYVSQLFNELGYSATVGKIINSARGNYEIDVFVEDRINIPNSTILIECKYWNTLVPQDVIFSFESRVQNSGANKGYVVSKKGFQSGAYDAIQNTVIEILDFESLLNMYYQLWITSRIDLANKKLAFFDEGKYDVLFEADCRVLSDEYGFYAESQRKEFRTIMSFYSYLHSLYINLKSNTLDILNEKKLEQGILNLVPLRVSKIQGSDDEIEVNCIGDVFRLIIDTDVTEKFQKEINDFIKKSQDGYFKESR